LRTMITILAWLGIRTMITFPASTWIEDHDYLPSQYRKL